MKNANVRDFGEIIGMLYKVEIKFFLKGKKKLTKK
jgi:hypothetical protein